MLGTSIGQKIVPHFVLQFGWRSVMLGCACLALALVCTMSIVLKNVPKDSQKQASLWSKIVDSGKQVSRIPTVWLAGIFCCGMFAVVTTFASLWGVPFLEAVRHISYINATSNIAFILLGIAIGGPTAGWLFGRFNSPKALMVGFSLGALCCTLLVLYSHVSNGLLYAGLLGMGLFCSIYVTAFSVVERATPAAIRGTAIGLCNAIALLGAIIFQPLIGWLLLHMQHNNPTDIAKTYQVSLSVLPGLMLIALISAFAIPKLSPKPESDSINESEQSIGPSLNEIIFKHNLANLGQYDTQYDETSSKNNISSDMGVVESPGK
jgi:MFS family permease